jgi:hypothetical protein
MLTQPQVQRYSTESGLRDIMIAEKEVVLTFLLQLLSERGILDRLAFKGGTCLRKMLSAARDDFRPISTSPESRSTITRNHPRNDAGVRAALSRNSVRHSRRSYYETQDGLSWGVNPTYSHAWNASGVSEVKLQVSRRETPTLPTDAAPDRAELFQAIALRASRNHLPRASRDHCRENPRLLSAQQSARHLRSRRVRHTAARSGAHPPPCGAEALAGAGYFDPARLMQKFQDGRDFDWDDLRQLLNRAVVIDSDRLPPTASEDSVFSQNPKKSY